MKLVINDCFGGFSLSARGVARYAELKGRECYFFVDGRGRGIGLDLEVFAPATIEQAEQRLIFYAYDIPDPSDIRHSSSEWMSMTADERRAANKLSSKHELSCRDIPRDDPDLIRVVEELGDKANGSCAKLKIVEIPDDVEWTIEEHDGNEHVAEQHRTWA